MLARNNRLTIGYQPYYYETKIIFVYTHNGIFNRCIFFNFPRDGGFIIESAGNIGLLSVGGDHAVFNVGGLCNFGSYADHRVVGPRVLRHGRSPGGGRSIRHGSGDLIRRSGDLIRQR